MVEKKRQKVGKKEHAKERWRAREIEREIEGSDRRREGCSVFDASGS